MACQHDRAGGGLTRRGRVRRRLRQLGAMGFLRDALASMGRRGLDPHQIPSYAQFGEDRILGGLFGSQADGWYVDVGCNHPIKYSNTWLLYRRGWKGLCVDGNAAFARLHARHRPRSSFACAVVANSSEPVEFLIPRASDLIAGIGESRAGPWARERNDCEVRSIRPERLDVLLERHGVPHEFDLLTIDVEGHESEVLASFDLATWRPGGRMWSPARFTARTAP